MNMSDEFYEEVADKFIFKVKKGLLYDENDVWTKINDGEAQFGVTDFLQRRGGDVCICRSPQEGKYCKKGGRDL